MRKATLFLLSAILALASHTTPTFGQCANGQCGSASFGGYSFAPSFGGGMCGPNGCTQAFLPQTSQLAHGWYQVDGGKLTLHWRGEFIGTLDPIGNVWQTAGKAHTVDLVKTFAAKTSGTCVGNACSGPDACAQGGICNACDKCTAAKAVTVAKSLPASVDPKSLREVAIPDGCALYQGRDGSLYILDRAAVAAAKTVIPTGAFVWQANK